MVRVCWQQLYQWVSEHINLCHLHLVVNNLASTVHQLFQSWQTVFQSLHFLHVQVVDCWQQRWDFTGQRLTQISVILTDTHRHTDRHRDIQRQTHRETDRRQTMSPDQYNTVMMWLSGNALVSINVVSLRQAWLVLGQLTICGWVNHSGM